MIVGAGTAGCMTAKTTAKAGLKICLIDRKERHRIGDKVCGDAIGKHHFDNLNLEYPRGDELERNIRGVKIHSPDIKTTFTLMGEGLEGFMINRYLFGQRLLKDAVDAGAELMDSTRAVEPMIKDGFVRGVTARRLGSDGKIELESKVVVDASGYSAAIRSKLPPEIGIDTEVNKEDVIVCYREIRKLKQTVTETGFCQIYLNLEVAPGAYYWIFPERETKVNVGLGVFASKKLLNPKNQLYKYVLSNRAFEGSEIVQGGGGFVPTRRPLGSMVGNGIVLVGDAACQVNPIHGGGMGPSMMGGLIAAETIAKALEEGDVSKERLWSVNLRFMHTYGVRQAGLDVFRIFLQGLTNEDLNYGMKYQLIKEEDILRTSLGEDVRLNITEATRRIFRGFGRMSLLKKLYDMANLSKKVKALYRNYPSSPREFPNWQSKARELFDEAKRLFG